MNGLGQDIECAVVVQDEAHLSDGPGRACLPEVDTGRRGWTVDVPSALPVKDEVVPQAVAGVHPYDEIEQPSPPLLEGVITGGRPEPVKQHASPRGVINTGHALDPAFASLKVLARRA